MTKRKNKPGAGRPAEGRQKLTCYVKPETIKAIDDSVNEDLNTRGKVIDRWSTKPPTKRKNVRKERE